MVANLEKELASTCIVFFDSKFASKTERSKKLWVYEVAPDGRSRSPSFRDTCTSIYIVLSPAIHAHPYASYRTSVHKTLKQNRLALSDFEEFIECYKTEDRGKCSESRQLLLGFGFLRLPTFCIHAVVHCSNSSRPFESKKIDRRKSFAYDELVSLDKTNLDIALLSAIPGLHSVSPSLDVIWLKDESLEDTENLPPPDVLAAEIVAQLEAALEEFRSVEEVLAGTGESE